MDDEIRRILDHQECWYCVHEEQRVPVLFAHPYGVFLGSIGGVSIRKFLAKLPLEAGQHLAVHIGTVHNGWRGAGTPVVIQHVDLPAIKGWSRITATEEHFVRE